MSFDGSTTMVMQETLNHHTFDTNDAIDASEAGRQSLASFAQKAHRRNLTSANGGVVSLRLSPEGRFSITPLEFSGEGILKVDAYLINENSSCTESTVFFSIPFETKFHFKAYKTRPEINAIAHLYPIYASAYSVRDGWFDLINGKFRTGKRILKVDCRACISKFCGLCLCKDDANRNYSGNDILFLKEDGIVILGQSLEEILDMCELVETFFRSYYINNFRKPL